MADIKQYRMEKNDGYESRLQKHRAKVMKTIMAAIKYVVMTADMRNMYRLATKSFAAVKMESHHIPIVGSLYGTVLMK